MTPLVLADAFVLRRILLMLKKGFRILIAKADRGHVSQYAAWHKTYITASIKPKAKLGY